MFRSYCVAISLALLASSPALAQMEWRDPESVVAAAVAADPTLARLRAEASAAREAVDVAGARPNPMVMTGVEDIGVDLEQDRMMTMYMVGASQRILRPSRREAREEVARAMSESVAAGIDARRAEIERDVRLAWYEVARIDEERRIVARLSEILRAIVDTARVRYEAGTASQADLIRAQLASAGVEGDLIELQGSREAAVSTLATLTEVPRPAEVPELQLENKSLSQEATPSAVAHPALRAARARLDAQQARVDLAELATRPDIELEAAYGYRPWEDGMISLTAKIELPLHRGSAIDPAIRESIALREAERYRIEEIERTISGELHRIAALQKEVIAQIALRREVLVPQGRLAVESALASFQTGLTTLDSVLGAQRDVVRLERELVSLTARALQLEAEERAVREGALAVSPASMSQPSITASAGSGM